MSNFFEIFNPGQRYSREQLETEKLLVVQDAQGGSGPDPLDLDSGSVLLRMPPRADGAPQDAPTTPEPDEGPDADHALPEPDEGPEADQTLPEPDEGPDADHTLPEPDEGP